MHPLPDRGRLQRQRHIMSLVEVPPRVLADVVKAVELVEHHDTRCVATAHLRWEFFELLRRATFVENCDLVLWDPDFTHCVREQRGTKLAIFGIKVEPMSLTLP